MYGYLMNCGLSSPEYDFLLFALIIYFKAYFVLHLD